MRLLHWAPQHNSCTTLSRTIFPFEARIANVVSCKEFSCQVCCNHTSRSARYTGLARNISIYSKSTSPAIFRVPALIVRTRLSGNHPQAASCSNPTNAMRNRKINAKGRKAASCSGQNTHTGGLCLKHNLI